MAEFASVLDDMYANTKITLEDVAPVVSTNPQVPKYALYLGLGLVALLAIFLLSRVKKEAPQDLRIRIPEAQETVHEEIADVIEKLKELPKPRDDLIFRISGSIPTADEDESGSEGKLSADKAEEAIQKYSNRG